MRKLVSIIFSLIALALIFSGPDIAGNNFAALLLPESTSPEQLKLKYETGELKVLIIPGHTEQAPGGQFGNLREVTLTRQMAGELETLFRLDSRLTVYTLEDLNEYLTTSEKEIESFLNQVIKTSKEFFATGVLKRKTDGIKHVRVPYNDALRLYGINKWANDNNVDLVLHVHFNDYPRLARWLPGDYSGFTIYIPERQLPNHRASSEIAKSVFNQTRKYFAVSNHPLEKSGLIESQDLIAIGAKASLVPASLLIEYGYIYEDQVFNEAVRPTAIRELAYQTYFGIKKFFEPAMASESALENITLPYDWQKTLSEGIKNSPDVFVLQLALTKIGFYPPIGSTKNNCPLNGNFGPCTRRAVSAFQKENNLAATGVADSAVFLKLK